MINEKGYIRFHGRNKEAWSKSLSNFGKSQTYEEQNARYDYLYSMSELKEFEQILSSFLKTIKTLFVIFNNHPKGKATANAFQMINLLTKRLLKIPQNTLSAFPQLTQIAAGQSDLLSKTNPGDSYDLFS